MFFYYNSAEVIETWMLLDYAVKKTQFQQSFWENINCFQFMIEGNLWDNTHGGNTM